MELLRGGGLQAQVHGLQGAVQGPAHVSLNGLAEGAHAAVDGPKQAPARGANRQHHNGTRKPGSCVKQQVLPLAPSRAGKRRSPLPVIGCLLQRVPELLCFTLNLHHTMGEQQVAVGRQANTIHPQASLATQQRLLACWPAAGLQSGKSLPAGI